ncbi:hypothetical protein C5167_032506 [Papaver somniferum]|uniref:tRNA (guanine(46)-N(7))-methyltransferase n=1 Tax=Papaver somniferum TaxID=3469 RepID=A0A4Y7KBU9_PAPSO|nr:hypothetical protein C5167_032506 [Papaver somniferum]
MKHAYAATASVAAECIINGMKKKNNSTFSNSLLSFSNKNRNLCVCPSCSGSGSDSDSDSSTFHQASSPNIVALEYADLQITNTLSVGRVGHVRIRQHVNPLTAALSAPVEVPDWNQIFPDSTLPLMVDIGCGSGRFLLCLAKKSPQTNNYLGLEIRQKLVDREQLWVKELSLSNIYFMFANATVCFDQIVSTYPGPLTFVSILCPDPHFKNRNRKRRVLQKILVESIIKNLRPGGKVKLLTPSIQPLPIFIQSDVQDVALDMRNQFDAQSDELQHVDYDDAVDQQKKMCDGEGWLLRNPMGIRTEREIHAECEGAKIYRRMYQKK